MRELHKIEITEGTIHIENVLEIISFTGRREISISVMTKESDNETLIVRASGLTILSYDPSKMVLNLSGKLLGIEYLHRK